ncbi:MAG: hypothetical protein WAR57_01070 [Candidatus Phosphoribacter sp.]
MSASVLPVLIRAEGETHRQLPMPSLMYAAIAMGLLLLLLALLWSFRGTAYKVRDKHSRPASGGHH